VGRQRSGAIALRNDQIYAEWSRKPNLPEIAKKFGITPQRVGQIIAEYHPDLETEHERALLRGSLWNLAHQVQEIIDNPGVKLGPNGRPAEDFDGDALPDLTTRVEAAKVQGGIYKQIAQLVGAEKAIPKQVQYTIDVAQQAMLRDIEEKRRAMITGEVIHEIEPPQPQPHSST